MTTERMPRGTPTPPRPLGQHGRELWLRVWALRKPWIDKRLDLDHVCLLAESVDERMRLRFQVLQDGSWRDRVALRQLDGQIADLMGALGLNPTDRRALRAADSGDGSVTTDDRPADLGLDPAVTGIAQFRARVGQRRAASLDAPSAGLDA
jgi:hypothetical protein